MKKTAIILGVGGSIALSASAIASSTVSTIPHCTYMVPGPATQENSVGWYLDGQHKLDVPDTWTTSRTYKELAQYGWCNVSLLAPSSHRIEEIKIGDPVGNFKVTSGFGSRERPCPGCSSWHPGIDVNTPVGIPLVSPGNVEVKCWTDGGGGGLVGEFWYDGMVHQFLHIDQCLPGPKVYGDVFAATGNTGRGTGPHLDYRVKMVDSQGRMARVYPPKQVLEFVVNPEKFIK